MNTVLISIIIGIVAGTIDIIPMIIQKLNKRDIVSAFLHYVALGIIIPFVDWGIPPWIKGVIIALIKAIPVMVIVYGQDRKAIIPMAVSSLLLGAGIGIAGSQLIGQGV